MLIAEEMYLLLTRADGTPEEPGAPRYFLAHGLAAGLAADLVVAERVAVTTDVPARVQVISAAPTGNPVLDQGLDRVRDREGRTLNRVIRQGRFNPHDAVVESLLQAGVLERAPRTTLGFGGERVTQRTAGPKERIQQRLARVFAGEAAPSATDAAVLVILKSLGADARHLAALSGSQDREDLDRRVDAQLAKAPATMTAFIDGIREMPPLAPHKGTGFNTRAGSTAGSGIGGGF